MTKNIHPVDELFLLREEKRKLETREKELRAMILDLECDLEGDEYVATVTRKPSSRLDRNKLEARFGKDAVAECCTDVETDYVVVSRKGTKPKVFDLKRIYGVRKGRAARG